MSLNKITKETIMTQQQQECPIDRNALHVDISVLCHRFPGGSDDSRQLQLPSKKKKKKQQPLLDFLQSAGVSTDAANKQLAL